MAVASLFGHPLSWIPSLGYRRIGDQSVVASNLSSGFPSFRLSLLEGCLRQVYEHEDIDGDVTAEVYQPSDLCLDLVRKGALLDSPEVRVVARQEPFCEFRRPRESGMEWRLMLRNVMRWTPQSRYSSAQYATTCGAAWCAVGTALLGEVRGAVGCGRL